MSAGLKEGMTVLDIGCGWGSFAKFAAEKYNVRVLGVTISEEQAELARISCQGLPVEIRLQDYRDLNQKFDRIVSLGMFEHVGTKNYKTFMKKVSNSLKDDGIFLLQTIGENYKRKANPWINKYIFPGGKIPITSLIFSASEGLFVLEDLHNFGTDYDKTIMEWYKNLNNNWYELSENYDKTFRRKWNYYLLSCAASFRSRDLSLWQLVYSKKGIPGGYKSIR